VKGTLVVPVFCGIVSDQVFPLVATCAAFLAHDETVPQLLAVSVTDPPAEVNEGGFAVIEHVAELPGVLQLTLKLPCPSGDTENVPPAQERLAPNVGTGTAANPADATAAASTRLMFRFMYMVYLGKRRRHATIAQSKPCAIYGMTFLVMTFSLDGAATRAATADKRLTSYSSAILDKTSCRELRCAKKEAGLFRVPPPSSTAQLRHNPTSGFRRLQRFRIDDFTADSTGVVASIRRVPFWAKLPP
jgi:hypothetical protein